MKGTAMASFASAVELPDDDRDYDDWKPRNAWKSIRIGQYVRFFRKSFDLVGVLERWEDDSDTQIANVEGWATIRLEDGSTRALRRSCGMGPGGWRPTAKSLRNTGDLRVERVPSQEPVR